MARKGRPKGSTNRSYLYTHAIPAVCVQCGSDKIKPVPGAAAMDQSYAGTLPDGTAYRGIRRQRCQCECGQFLIVKTFLVALSKKDNSDSIKAG